MEPVLEIRMVRENLALAIAVWTAVKKGLVTTAHLPTGRSAVTSDAGRVVEIFNPLELHGEEDLVRGATNQVRAAFAFSVLQTQRTLESVYDGQPLQDADQDRKAARCAIYLLNNSMRRGMLTPTWSCPLGYRRSFKVGSISFSLDASELDGKTVYWDDFGGLEKYLELLLYLAEQAKQPPPKAASSSRNEDAPDVSSIRREFMEAASPSDPVSQFISARCMVGPDYQTIAGGLYDEYVKWCQETGQDTLGQRSFGMQLTRLGFTRRRRGRGRHWWQGIGLAGATGARE
jgi:hypothetical protein